MKWFHWKFQRSFNVKLNEAVSIWIARNRKNINFLFDKIANFFYSEKDDLRSSKLELSLKFCLQ